MSQKSKRGSQKLKSQYDFCKAFLNSRNLKQITKYYQLFFRYLGLTYQMKVVSIRGALVVNVGTEAQVTIDKTVDQTGFPSDCWQVGQAIQDTVECVGTGQGTCCYNMWCYDKVLLTSALYYQATSVIYYKFTC